MMFADEKYKRSFVIFLKTKTLNSYFPLKKKNEELEKKNK